MSEYAALTFGSSVLALESASSGRRHPKPGKNSRVTPQVLNAKVYESLTALTGLQNYARGNGAKSSECLKHVIVDWQICCLNNRNTIGLIGPAAKIDLLATLGTERTPRIFGRPQGVLATLRTANLANSHQRLQKVKLKNL